MCIPVWHFTPKMNYGVFMTQNSDDYKLLSVEDIMGVMTCVEYVKWHVIV